MIEFLTNNWQFIAAVGLGIIELILMIVLKKRPEIVDNSIFEFLCGAVKAAEEKFVIGSDKMAFVLDLAKKHLGKSYNEGAVRAVVEYILTLPEKKGVSK